MIWIVKMICYRGSIQGLIFKFPIPRVLKGDTPYALYVDIHINWYLYINKNKKEEWLWVHNHIIYAPAPERRQASGRTEARRGGGNTGEKIPRPAQYPYNTAPAYSTEKQTTCPLKLSTFYHCKIATVLI